MESIAEGQATHARLDTQDVVVHREQLLQGRLVVGLHLHGHLSVVNAREVAGAGRLVLLRLQGEGVHVDAGVWSAGVVVERLHCVEVVAVLLLEAVLTVQDHLEQVQGTNLHAWGSATQELGTLLDPEGVTREGVAAQTEGACDRVGSGHQHWNASRVGQDVVVGSLQQQHVGRDVHVACGCAEVPHGILLRVGGGVGVGVAPHQLLHWVVEGQTDQLDGALSAGCGQLVTACVLHLLNQVLVTLLGEAAALLRVQVHIVSPHLKGIGCAEVVGVVGRQVEVQAHLVVLEGDQGQVQTWVAVEEEEQREVHLGRRQSNSCSGVCEGVGHCCHLAPRVLVGLIQEHLSVQAPPCLVVLVDALTTDRQLNGGNGTLSHPVGVVVVVVGCQNVGRGCQGDVHVADQVTVAGNGDGHATAAAWGAVRRLLDQLHCEVGVTLVHRLEESHLRVTCKVNVLCAVGNKLHKSSRHFDISKENKSGRAAPQDINIFVPVL